MASQKDLELLDDYLRNRLDPQEKSAFEQALKNDAALQRELRVQQRVVEGLRKARVAELKQLLNNVPVTAVPGEGMSMLAKVGAWLVVAGLAGGGLYIYYNSEEQPADNISANTPHLAPDTHADDKATHPAVENIQPPLVKGDETNKESVQDQAVDSGQKISESTTGDPVAPAARDVFEPADETRTAESSSATDSGKGTAGVITTPSITVEAGINGNNGKYNFHYQFKDNKLFLYGVFEKNLYELMEFFSNNKRTLFLYYKDRYYLLSEDDSKVKRLTPISDPALLKKLRDYRSAR
jgi:hypothetical protein